MKNKIKLEGSSSFVNLRKAIANLRRSLATPVAEPRDLSGIIRDFEMVYELSWKVIKKVLLADGVDTTGPKDVLTKAFQLGYIDNEAAWLGMIQDRNNAAHVYDEAAARVLVDRIRSQYLGLVDKTFDA
ncbi:MAG: nucleotidyltransferase [Deltaproteobacteria bacterium]|nr:nucleotidyltransferase [Deltaproteobacteria bacterium]